MKTKFALILVCLAGIIIAPANAQTADAAARAAIAAALEEQRREMSALAQIEAQLPEPDLHLLPEELPREVKFSPRGGLRPVSQN